MAHARQFHIGGWAAWVLAPILGLVGLVLTLADRMTGGGKADLSAEEVWTYLDDFINGRGGEWDWSVL